MDGCGYRCLSQGLCGPHLQTRHPLHAINSPPSNPPFFRSFIIIQPPLVLHATPFVCPFVLTCMNIQDSDLEATRRVLIQIMMKD